MEMWLEYDRVLPLFPPQTLKTCVLLLDTSQSGDFWHLRLIIDYSLDGGTDFKTSFGTLKQLWYRPGSSPQRVSMVIKCLVAPAGRRLSRLFPFTDDLLKPSATFRQSPASCFPRRPISVSVEYPQSRLVFEESSDEARWVSRTTLWLLSRNVSAVFRQIKGATLVFWLDWGRLGGFHTQFIMFIK